MNPFRSMGIISPFFPLGYKFAEGGKQVEVISYLLFRDDSLVFCLAYKTRCFLSPFFLSRNFLFILLLLLVLMGFSARVQGWGLPLGTHFKSKVDMGGVEERF